MNKLALELLADTNGLLKGLDQAQRSVDKFTNSAAMAGSALGSGVNRALDAFTGLATGGAAAAGVLAGGFAAATVAAGLLAVSAGAQAEAIEMLAQKTGISTTTLQGWSVVMAENNLQGESLTTAMRTLSKQIIEARDPASKAAAAFEEMGISVAQLGTTDSTLRAVADRFKSMPDGVDKARMAVELFGKSGLELIPMLNRGAKAFDESRQAAISFGAVLSGEQLAALSRVDDAADRLGIAFTGLKNRMALLFAPGTEAAIKIITESFAMLSRGLASVDTALDTLAIRFSHFALAVNTIAKQTFSLQVFNVDAWKQTLADIRQIDAEAAKLIEKRRQLEAGGGSNGPSNDGHVAAFVVAQGEKQEALGRKILAQSIEKYKLTIAEGHAQEALGRVANQIAERQRAERNAAFAQQMELQEQVNNLQFGKRDTSVFDKQLAAVKNLMELIPGLTVMEANLLALHNQGVAEKVIKDTQDRLQLLKETESALRLAADTEEAWAVNAAAQYQQLGPLFGDALLTRQYALDAVDARLAASTAHLDSQLANQLISQEEYWQKVRQLELRADAQRRGLAQQFPTFFEQQMQALVQSNVFSLAQISTNFTNATAQWIVTGQNFAQFWQSLQVTMVQAFLNTLVQMFANWVLHSTAMQAAAAALETAKTAIFGVGEKARTGIAVATTAGISAAMLPQLAAIMAIGTAAIGIAVIVAETIAGIMSAAASAAAIIPGGQPMAGALIAGATKLSIGASVAAAIGIAAIQAAAGAAIVSGGLGFNDGGIGDFGEGTRATLHGREAIIPLNKRGADFMRESLGMGSGRGKTRIEVPVYLNGRQIAFASTDEQISVLRQMGAL